MDAGRASAGGRSRIGSSVTRSTWPSGWADDPHVWASALYDEVKALGYEQSYVTFAREVRRRRLRPRREACSSRRGHGPTIEIEHEPGEEIPCGKPHSASCPGGSSMWSDTSRRR